jgi:hypothetical protein
VVREATSAALREGSSPPPKRNERPLHRLRKVLKVKPAYRILIGGAVLLEKVMRRS